MFALCLIIWTITGLCKSQIAWNFDADSDSIFHGYIVEKTREIFVYPPLHVKLKAGSKLCYMHLLPTATNLVPNFISSEILDPTQGHARLVLNESALFAARKRGDPQLEGGVFHLKVAGEDCSHPHHTTRPWSINLLLVPTDQPVWAEQEYTFTIDSTLSAGSIVGKVTAYAALDMHEDRMNQLGDDTGMCNYAIDHPEQNMFDINGHGVIRSRVSLTNHGGQRFLLNVTAFDCHIPVPRRSTVRVMVIVRQNCTIEWKNIDPELVYTALPRAHWVARNAELKTCQNEVNRSDSSCQPTEATLRVKMIWSREDEPDRDANEDDNDDVDEVDGNDSVMETDPNASFVCDLDVLSVRAHSQSCGVLPDSVVELLPSGRETPISFNGSSQWDVTADKLGMNRHRLDNVPFTLTFWMRHSPHDQWASPSSPDEANGREHIVCSSDEQEKNRHHFAVYVHNCKLTMLLRHEPINERANEHIQLYPSQWRFSVDDVCDRQWHHYALSFHPSPSQMGASSVGQANNWIGETQVKLLIDGDLVPMDADLVQITEDVPMHELRHHSTETRLSVGACWHSRSGHHVQHFQGDLAALMLTIGTVMSDEQVQCLANCYPRLHVTGPLRNAQLPDLPPLHQSRLDNLIVQANHLSDLTDLMQHVIFFNPRINMWPTRRPEPMAIQLSTTVKFPSQCQSETVQDKTISLVRLPLTKTVEASVWSPVHTESFSPPSDANSTGSFISTTGRVIPTYSLFLQDPRPLTDPIPISSANLMQGVWLFPAVQLSWIPLAEPQKSETMQLGDAVSHCDVDLCPVEPNDTEPVEFARQETLTVGTDFLAANMRVEQSSNGMRFRGPVTAKEMTQTLGHLKWFNLEYTPPRKRCFRLICVAQANTHGGPQLMVQSNILRIVFSIESNGERVRPRVAKALNRYHHIQSINPQQSSIEQLHTGKSPNPHSGSMNVQTGLLPIQSAKTQSNDPSWNRGLNLIYTFLGCAMAIVLIAIALGLTYFFRIRRIANSTPPKPNKSGWEQVPTVTNFANSSTGPVHRSSGSNTVTKPVRPQNGTLEVIVNPTTNRREFEEMEKKFCFYDKKMYDEEEDDILDPDNPAFHDTIYDSEQDRLYRSYMATDDPHEDVSDFDVPSERETVVETATHGTQPDEAEKCPNV